MRAETCYNLGPVVCQPKPEEAKNLNVCWTVMFTKGKPENKNVYCKRERERTENCNRKFSSRQAFSWPAGWECYVNSVGK